MLNLNLKLLVGVISLVTVVGTLGYGALILNENDNLNLNNSNQIILNDATYSNAPQDPFSITNVTRENDMLSIAVSYGGGCAEHQFNLIGSISFMESSPVQMNILLSHNANGDNCEMLIMKDLTFSISPIKQLYQQVYSETNGTVILNLDDTEDPIVYQF